MWGGARVGRTLLFATMVAWHGQLAREISEKWDALDSSYFCISVDWLAAHSHALPSFTHVSVNRPWW